MIHKLWFYFRHGYAYYIAAVLAPFNTIMLIIGFSDKLHIPTATLYWIIPILAAVGVPCIILLGRYHYRRAYDSEMEVMAKNNPYNFKVIPNSMQHKVILPIYLEILQNLKKSDPNNQNIIELEEKLRDLIK